MRAFTGQTTFTTASSSALARGITGAIPTAGVIVASYPPVGVDTVAGPTDAEDITVADPQYGPAAVDDPVALDGPVVADTAVVVDGPAAVDIVAAVDTPAADTDNPAARNTCKEGPGIMPGPFLCLFLRTNPQSGITHLKFGSATGARTRTLSLERAAC